MTVSSGSTFAIVAAMTSPVAKITDELEAKAAAFVKEHRLPGAAVGVVHGDDLVWSAGVGFADVASRRAPDTSTLYRIASITKTFTGTAIMQLRDEGRLHLDDPLVAYVPELRDAASPFGPIETVTIRRMLSHESGLAGDPPGTDWSTPPVYEGLIAPQPGAGRRDRHADPAEHAAEVLEPGVPVARRGRVACDRRAVRRPRALGDPRTARHDEHVSSSRCPTRRSRAAPPGTTRGGSPTSSASPTSRVTVWAEGGLWSCVSDLARWISFQLREDAGRATARRCWPVPR